MSCLALQLRVQHVRVLSALAAPGWGWCTLCRTFSDRTMYATERNLPPWRNGPVAYDIMNPAQALSCKFTSARRCKPVPGTARRGAAPATGVIPSSYG